MKKRLLLIINILTVTVYMAAICGCANNDDQVGSEGIAINPDGTPIEQSDAASSASTQEEAWQDPMEYLDPALDILSWKCVNDVAAGKAIDLIDKALEVDDSLTAAYKGRGSAYLCLGDSIAYFDMAEADFIKMQELEPDNPDGYLGQAEVLIRKGKKDEAIELLEKAKELINSHASSSGTNASGADNSGAGESGSGDSATEGASGVETDGANADGSAEGVSDASTDTSGNSAGTGTEGSETENADGTGAEGTGTESVDGTGVENSDTENVDSDSSTGVSSDGTDGDNTSVNNDARYNSGISEIFMTSESDIQARIDELNSDEYSDSKGRVRYTTIYNEDGTVMESLFYACYFYGEDESNIIVSYNPEGSMIATVFKFYEGTDEYVYGMYTSANTWNVCIPMWSDDGVMTGIETVYGGSVIAYDMYLYDSENTMIGTEQYNSSKTLENTVYFEGYSADNATNGGAGVVGTPKYTIDDIYDLLGKYIS